LHLTASVITNLCWNSCNTIFIEFGFCWNKTFAHQCCLFK